MSSDLIAIGIVTAVHGVAGYVRVLALGSFPERFRSGMQVRLSSNLGEVVSVEDVKIYGTVLLLKLAGVEDRETAENLRGCSLLVPKTDRYPLPADTYYVDDLLGLRVVTKDGRAVGSVVDVEPNPANDLLVVALDAGGHALIPAVRALATVEIERGRVVVDAIPGLLPVGEDGSGAH